MKYRIFLQFIFIFVTATNAAQIDNDLNVETYTLFNNVRVLIDENYTFSQVINDTTLHFTKQPRISVKGIDYYWIKYTVQNNSGYDKKFAIWTMPLFDSRLYFFNKDKKSWQSVRGGAQLANNRNYFPYLSCVFPSHKTTTIYIKVKVTEINKDLQTLQPSIALQSYYLTKSNREKDHDWWLATVAIVLSFLIYNAYWYFMIKKKAHLYYLIMLMGGIVYVTCETFFLSLFTNFKTFNTTIIADGTVDYIPIEWLLLSISITVMIFGLVQYTRTYLQSKVYLAQWDRIIATVLKMFILFEIIINFSYFFEIIAPNNLYGIILNVFILIIVVTILIIGFKSYAQKRKEATYFLIALFIPLSLVIVLAVLLIISQNNQELNFLSHITIWSITITFAVALVAEVNLIKEELSLEKLEKEATSASIAIEKERNFRLEEKIAYDKNEVVAAQHIKLLMKELHHRVKNNLQIVSSLLSLQSFRIKDQAAIDAVKEGQHRIEAMSLIHQKLYVQDNITKVNMKEFISDIAESLMQAYGYKNDNFSLEINVTETHLDVDKAIPLSIIINELITNAFKYAYKDIEKPVLKISFNKTLQITELTITDNGIGMDVNAWETNEGYGKELVQTFAEQLEGTLTLTVNNGTSFQIVFPF